MGQNVSMEGHPLLNEYSGEDNKPSAGASLKISKKPIEEKLEDTQDSSGDSDMKSNSVRAAIDSLIETCLGVKSDDSETEDSKKDSDEVANEVLPPPTTSPAAPAPPPPPPPACVSQLPVLEKDNTAAGLNSVNMVVNFMKDRITNMIQNDKTDEDITPIQLSRVGCDESVPKIVISESGSGRLQSNERVKYTQGSACESAEKKQPLPKNTMRLQTLIDKVLDHSLGEDVHSSLPDIGNQGQLSLKALSHRITSPIPRSSPQTAQHTSTNSKASDATVTKRSSPETKSAPNRNVMCLKDHIERVLERSFMNEELLSRDSPPPEPRPVPKHPVGGSITHGKPVPNADGNISVQDIVNRVISQTEVISKLLSPDGKEIVDGTFKDSHNTTGDVSKSTKHHHSQEHFREREERFHHSHPSSKSPSRYPGPGPGHGAPSTHNEAYSEAHNHWNKKGLPDGHMHTQQHYLMDSIKQHIDQSAMYAPVANHNEAMLVQHHNQREMSQHMNGGVPRQAMMPNAQMYMLRGHPMYMAPRLLPPPLMRADELEPLMPHAPTRNCRCMSCVVYFQMEEKSKQNKPSPLSPSAMMSVAASQAEHQLYHGHQHLPVSTSRSSNLPVHTDAVGMMVTSPNKFPNPVHMANMMQYRPPMPVNNLMKHASLSGGHGPVEANMGDAYGRGARLDRRPDAGSYGREVYRREEGREEYPPNTLQARIADGHGVGKHGQPGVGGGGGRPDIGYPHHVPTALPAHARDGRFPPAPVLDLTVKVPETVIPEQSGPSSKDGDQPLDLSKKPSRAAVVPNDMGRREMTRGAHGNHQMDFNPHGGRHDTYHQEKQQQGNGQHPGYGWREAVPPERGGGGGLVAADASSNALMSGMMVSPGGHRPQLHPIPAPTFSTTPSTMPPALSPVRPISQMSTSHSQAPPSHQGPTQEKSSPKTSSSSASYLSQASAPPQLPQQQQQQQQQQHQQQLRESPQSLPSPQGSDKGDPSQRRGSVSRHEPIQSIIGNHPPNDILYLICRLCRQTYGSPYGFRKHFRNQHGFEPRAEHTIVQTISATKSAMQGPYVLGSQEPIGEPMIPSGRSSAPPERESIPIQGSDFYRGRKDGTPSPMEQRGVSPGSHSQQDWPSGKARMYRRGSDGRPKSSLREDSEDTKYLECPECKQTFQLNDFGSYKRHCRQHNQARSSGSFVGSDSQARDSQSGSEQSEKHVGRIAACRICGCHFSVAFLDEHIKSVHFKDQYNDSQSSQSKKHLISSIDRPTSGEGHSPKVRADSDISRSSPDFQKYLTEPVPTPYLEVQRLPADQITVSASPDSSSDKPGGQSEYTQPVTSSNAQTPPQVPETSGVDSSRTRQDGGDRVSGSVSDSSKAKEMLYVQGNMVEDDKDSGFSGERCSSSESRSMSIESAQEGVSLASPAEGDEQQSGFYRHKKFGNNRKRKESCENNDSDSKVPRVDQNPGSNSKDDENSGSSAQSTVKEEDPKSDTSSGEGAKKTSAGSKEQEAPVAPKKTEPRAKQEARHQLPFVWDRVTRIQAGKNIKPPDYMT